MTSFNKNPSMMQNKLPRQTEKDDESFLRLTLSLIVPLNVQRMSS